LNTYEQVSNAFSNLGQAVEIEAGQHLFLFVPRERAAFFGQPELFGVDVNKRFPFLQHDIEEAGNCYALGRGSACVFHLMRVMESVVQDFGTTVGVTLTGEKNWQVILDEINAGLRNLAKGDSRKIALHEAASHLYNVKTAWRNPTMHPKSSYSTEEARQILESVRSFVGVLAKSI
jgi:hypothetical protein